ncbi:MAG: TetR/AcrR family transcriptional regulator [Rhizobiaceae bacterium]|nr:TetR/AcrR family transcriptional regulator [Rhizobiaceae bacterium]
MTESSTKNAKRSTANKVTKRIPNEVRRERSREALLKASEELFVARGYAITTVEDIASQSGLTKGAIYFHFKDKSGVLIALIDRAEERVLEPLLVRLEDPNRTPDQKIIDYLHYWSRIGIEQRSTMFLPILMSLEFNGTGTDIEQHLDRMYGRVYEALIRIIEDGHRQGVIRKAAPAREQAAMLIAMMDGTLLEWMRREDRIDGPALTRGLRSLLLQGLISSPPADS